MARRPPILAAIIAGLLVAAPASAAVSIQSEEKTIARLSNEWMQALARKDRAALDRIIAADFALQTPGGDASDRVPRQAWIDNAIEMDWSDLDYENLSVRVRGDQALVTSRLHFRVAPMPIRLDSGIIDTWEKRDGRWQVTGRYLGESTVQQRLAFTGGLFVALIAGVILYVVTRVLRRRRRAKD